jgi:hypothetical protein
MFSHLRRDFTSRLRRIDRKGSRRQRSRSSGLVVEALESRALLAPLTWAGGASLPLAEAGIVAPPEGSVLLTMAGPATTSYTLSATYPSWQASTAATVQALDFARSAPGVGTLPNGYFLVYGGLQNGFATSAVTQYDPNTVTVVDGATNQTRSLRSMNVPRAEFGWATDANNLSYAIGGQDNNGTPLATMEVYNPTANTWTYLASLPQTLYGESAISDGAGHIYTFGGVAAGGAVTNLVYRYTIATNTWDQSAAPMQVGVRDSAAVLGPSGSIYVVGGQTAAGSSPSATATVESYNTSTNTWNLETSLPQPLYSAAAAVDSLGRIAVLGGDDVNGNPLATTYVSQEFTQPDLAPTITSTPPATGTLNHVYSYQLASTGNPQASYTLTTAPAGMMINASTGLINWTPTALGSASVTVQASSPVGQVTQSFSINVILPTPPVPTGVTGTPLSATSLSLSWNPSPDPNVTSYDVYERFAHVYHSPRGSGGGVTYTYSLVASGITGTSVILSASGTYGVAAVNFEGYQSAPSAYTGYSVATRPDLYVATTTSGADIGFLNLNVGQTGQIDLIQAGANPAPTYSLVSGPAGVMVNATTGLVTYTPAPGDIGQQIVTFAASNIAGTSTLQFVYNVLALQPNVTVNSGAVTYDGNPQGVSATAVGVDGVTPVAGSFAFDYGGSSTPPTAAGTYTVTTTFTSGDPSYASSVVTGTLTINPAAPTVTVDSGPFTSDGVTPQAATATAVGVDGFTAVDGGFTITYNGSATPPVDPGLYTVSAAFASNDPNYTSPTVTTSEIVLSTGTLTPTLTLIDGSASYDGNPHADSGTAVGTDGLTAVAGDFLITYNGSTTVPTDVGTYAVDASFISADSTYADAEITGTMTISAVAPTLTVDPNPLVYNGNGQAAVVSAVGVDGATPVDGTFSVTYDGAPDLPVNAGTYTVVASFTSNDPNYVSTSITGVLTINPATPSVGLGNGGQWEFAYNGQPQTVTGSVVGVDGVTPVSGYFTYEYYNEYGSNTQLFGPPLPGPPTAPGSYTFIEYFNSLDPNYGNGSFSWYLTVFSASPTLTLSAGPFTYNGSPQGAVVSAVGIDGVTPVAGSVTYATYNGSTNVPSGAGTYNVFAEWSSTDPNYDSGTVSGTYTIAKATPTFTGLSSPAVNAGTSTVMVSGHISAGSLAPGGDDVAVTLNGVTQPATVSGGGSFSTTFSVAGLATGTYPITYSYLGDPAHFGAASNNNASGTLTVQAAPSIVTSPASQAVVSGSSVTFTASATGYPVPTVQWQQSTNGTNYTNIAGATSSTYTISAVTNSQNNYRYRAVFTNSVGTATTAVATLTVQYAPTVTTNPSSATVNAGSTATFTAAAGGNPAPTVQWQVSTDGGSSFTPIAGATGTSLTVSGTTASQNGYIYQAVFTNSVGSTATTNATLTVRYAPTVSASPASQTVNAGQSVTFTAAATGNPTPTVQWQVSTNGGTSYSNISGATSTTYTISATTSSQNGNLYRAVFTNSVGSATTVAATLSVQFAPSVSSNPSSQTATAGQTATFTAAARGNPAPTVQWQVSTNGGSTYTNIAGATSATLTLSGVTASQNGYRYRAVFTSSLGSATSSAATLTVQYAPTVTTNPVNQSVTHGQSVTFTAAASGNPTPTVQWQVSTDGGNTFTNISGATSTHYTISSTTVSQNGYLYQAVFTNSIGSATTTAAILTVI